MQNSSNDSRHSAAWAHSAKGCHASLFSVHAAVAEAVFKFNGGSEGASAAMLKELKVNPGPPLKNTWQRRTTADQQRQLASVPLERTCNGH